MVEQIGIYLKYVPQECKLLRATQVQFTASLWPLSQTIFKRIGQARHKLTTFSTRLQGISKVTLQFCHLLLFKIVFSGITEVD